MTSFLRFALLATIVFHSGVVASQILGSQKLWPRVDGYRHALCRVSATIKKAMQIIETTQDSRGICFMVWKLGSLLHMQHGLLLEAWHELVKHRKLFGYVWRC